jgi:hypothetical protein
MPGQYVKKVGDTYKQVKRRTTYSGSEVLKAPQGARETGSHIRRFKETRNRIKPMEKEKMATVNEEIQNMVDAGTLSKEAADRITKKASFLGSSLKRFMGGMSGMGDAKGFGNKTDEWAEKVKSMMRGKDSDTAGKVFDGLKKNEQREVAKKMLEGSGNSDPSTLNRFGVGIGLAGGLVAAEEGMDRYQAHETRKQMMHVFPELQREDPEKVDRAFNVLKTYSPTLTRDPHVAGSAVAKMIQYEVVDPATIKTLLETQKADNQPGRRLIDAARTVGQAVI